MMTGPEILKVSVLATNELLLDGQPVTLAELKQVIEQGAKANAVVWYYREEAASGPPSIAVEAFKVITNNRLPVRLSSRPDFSDTVTSAIEFASVREKAAQGQLVIVRPDGKQLLLPALAKEAAPPNIVASVERMLPSKIKRNVAVIGDTAWATAGTVNLQTANQAIPFFGLLMGFAAIGHAVWIFDGNAALLNAGCRDADVLIVDSERVAALPADWQISARKVMRNSSVLVHDRATYQLRKP